MCEMTKDWVYVSYVCCLAAELKVYSHDNAESVLNEMVRKPSSVVRPLDSINVKPTWMKWVNIFQEFESLLHCHLRWY